ncbi:glutathione S-transferase C-terminal domain-containing protein [Streptomyces sp. LHD-70]|uniref:glutathione S-transferase family protein n=1 Tax=Streptomyces sp. LHD-70 TaxID=3072140 RepID=UPI00280FFDA5|nr:glutathione S-transferase C-terminal domain-containing protein [Streptomyces sp. LHD-70]MDQ8707266.1 glutathione S-transferase C-terminal domain-containing protein [Streptomyces sp. LHD-70]
MKTDEAPTREHVRAPQHFTARVRADGADGWPVQADRYRLVINRACPWAHRVVLARTLLGLDPAVQLALTDPVRELVAGDHHWVFSEETGSPGGIDPVLGIHALREAYLAAEPDYTGRVTVPALVDIPSGKLVSNDFDQLLVDFATEWRAEHRPGAPDLYPAGLREEIEAVSQEMHTDLNDGVYRAGFAPSQESYERAVTRLFAYLDRLEQRLTDRRYLVGDRLTVADLRLWPTLIRFDAVYHGLFKCNARRIKDYPALWAYTRDLYQTPGFAETVDFDQIKRHYYYGMTGINPTRIVPTGPDLGELGGAHGRELLGPRSSVSTVGA